MFRVRKRLIHRRGELHLHVLSLFLYALLNSIRSFDLILSLSSKELLFRQSTKELFVRVCGFCLRCRGIDSRFLVWFLLGCVGTLFVLLGTALLILRCLRLCDGCFCVQQEQVKRLGYGYVIFLCKSLCILYELDFPCERPCFDFFTHLFGRCSLFLKSFCKVGVCLSYCFKHSFIYWYCRINRCPRMNGPNSINDIIPDNMLVRFYVWIDVA